MNYKIISKYIKDLDFKIPNPKIFSILSKSISNYKINIDIKSNQIREKIIQVETTLNLTPIKDDIEKISTKIIYATIIELNDGITDKKEIEKIILINVPSKIYPELRKIFIFVFESSGFKDIKISNNVDFQKLYNLKKAQ
jgi:preprotein translocase subunit SecB